MSERAEALSIAGLRIRYGDREVLRGLDLTVAAGQIFGLLGPNGAGKTTLIRSICGRIKPIAGAVSIAGRPASRQALRHIGLVPQEIALYPHLTARENLDVFGRLSGLGHNATQAAIAWASEAAGLAQRLDDRVAILSGGWKRRVNIAAAILHRPALLILDEPTVGVDIDARNGLQETILQLSQAGMGVLLATHDLDQAESLCSTVGFLRNGVLAPQGQPRALIKQAFGDQKEIVLELRQAAPDLQAQWLLKAGFIASNNGLCWSMHAEGAERWTTELSVALERAGVALREIRLREPGLDSLFVVLSRQPASAAEPVPE